MQQVALTFIIFIFCSIKAFSWSGSICGKVTDHKSLEGVIGANVIIQGTTVGTATDLEGNFQINSISPGLYTLVISSVTYKTQTITDVVVKEGVKSSIEVVLIEDVAELEEIVVTAKRDISTDFNLINTMKESKLVVSGISSEQMAKLPDLDAAQVMQRVPGITVADSRFVLVRGLPERYNQVMVNGMIAPSTEIDKRSFSFDIIPAGTMDQMLVYKSGAPELPGDFAGGVIQMTTKNPTYEEFTSVGLTFGYRTNTTFADYNSSQGSSTDILGFDNGFRDLPEDFPSTQILETSARNSSLRERAGKSLTNNFGYTTKKAPLDMGFNFSWSQNFKFGKIKAGNLTALAYSNSYHNYQFDFLRYNSFTATSADKRFEYKDNFTSNDTRINLMHNWLFSLNDRNRIEFKNLFVQLGEDENTIRKGTDFIQRPNDDLLNYAYHYLSRSIYSGQLDGTHTLGDGSMHLNWVAGFNYIKRNEPDYRRFRTYRNKTLEGTEVPFTMQLPPSGNLFETGRFYSDLMDKAVSHGLNFEKKFGRKNEKQRLILKAGYYTEFKTRSFGARYLNYLYPGTSDPTIGMKLSQLPLDQIFAPENIKKQDGFVIEEGTQVQDSYTGTNLLTAGYASGTVPFEKFDLSIGFRGEFNSQTLTAQTNTGKVNVNNPIFAPLPSVNVAYHLTDRSLVRAAYSRTVNRPEFRELAPFLYYQFEYEAGIFGNSNLKTAFIHNIDLRYELFPNPGETLSIGTFYKSISNPIETYLQITAETPQLYFGNAESATDVGVELEIKKSLAGFGLSRIFRNISFNLNAAVIKSIVNVGTQATNQAQYRPLQGQSPYIINVGLYYNEEATGLALNGAYNIFGQRIFTVGDKVFPSWFEMPRHSMDFQIAKNWSRKKTFETKLNIQNVLNYKHQIYQDNNSNNRIEKQEALIQKYRTGTHFSLALSWKIK